MRLQAPLLALLLLACGPAPAPTVAEPLRPPPVSSASASSAPPSAEPRSYQTEKETLLETAKGASFPVAPGWFVRESAELTLLEDPERGLKMAMIEVEVASAREAIEVAWKRHDAAFVRKELNTMTPPPGKWDEVVQITYETEPGSKRLVLANARRKGGVVWVAILDGEKGAFDRRGAQLQDTFERLKAPGVAEETLAGKKAHPLEGERLKKFTDFIEKTRATLGIPGAAVAVVQGGKLVLEQGFGVREMGKKGVVDPSTLFLIGSTSKSLSTLLMARAVDEKKFSWDTRAQEVYPGFTLGDRELAGKVTMKNLVCACTGIPRYDMELLFTFDKVKPESLLASMASLKPTTAFGETFQYNNQMVAAGGFLAAHALYPKLPLGEAFDRAMKEYVFGPLDMKETTLSFAEGQRRGMAGSHDEDELGKMQPMPMSYEQFVVPLRPSGGVISNVRDMAKYLQAELARGKSVTGKQVASEENVLLRRKPQVKIQEEIGYGLGFIGGKFKGIEVVEHGGATFGHRSTFLLFPEAGIGMTLLANGPGPLGSLAKARLLELLFDRPEEAEAALAFQMEEKKKGLARLAEKMADPEPAEVLKKLVGSYQHEVLGAVQLREEKGKLTLDAGEWKSRVVWSKRSDGKKDLMLLDPPVLGLTFEVREKDGKPALFLSFLQHEYTFTRR
jgi:CubicO group peptidase (beta-lactamase class C family)